MPSGFVSISKVLSLSSSTWPIDGLRLLLQIWPAGGTVGSSEMAMES